MNALDEFVSTSATKYLQSVVFVDDHIYHSDDKPLETAIIPTALKPQFAAISEHASDEGAGPGGSVADDLVAADDHADSRSEEIYHPRQLMESFAQKGIVCALYEPREGFSVDHGSELFRLCERADVIILDWDLHNDGGERVCRLLSELIRKSQSESPHHVRFCAIYTTQQSLHSVVESLLKTLERDGCTVDVEESKLHLIAGASRVSVFGKPSAITRIAAEKPYEVIESDLANRVIAEFSDFHHGVLPAFALHGLASVRRNAKRLLDRFSADLDGAFLLHRALILEVGEAFDELPDLLSDEIRAILEDSWPDSSLINSLVEVAAGGLNLVNPIPRWTKNGADIEAKDTFIRFLKEGRRALWEKRNDCDLLADVKQNSYQGIRPKLLSSLESMLVSQGRSGPQFLSVLFCNRTQYREDRRRLHFGTLVRHKSEGQASWSYSLCLMPICDSQRLAGTKSFPFWRLKDNVFCGLDQKRYGVAIEENGAPKPLAAGGKMREMLWLHDFTPDVTGWVTAAKSEGVFRFEAADIQIEWVGELKPLHAQRIAAHMGSDVSRVGLVESEWLRLFCDR